MYRYHLVVCLVALSLAMGCKRAKGNVEGEVEGGTVQNESRFIQLAAGKTVEGDKAEEARAWLDSKNTSNVLWKTSKAQTLKFVNDFYEAGAVKVYAVYMPKEKEVPINMCAELFLQLPADKEQRKKVIKAFNKVEKQLWGDDAERAKDEGQKYLYLNMDP